MKRSNADVKRSNADVKRSNADVKRSNADAKRPRNLPGHHGHRPFNNISRLVTRSILLLRL